MNSSVELAVGISFFLGPDNLDLPLNKNRRKPT